MSNSITTICHTVHHKMCRNITWCKCTCHLDDFVKDNNRVRAALKVLHEIWRGNFHSDPAAMDNPSAIHILRITFDAAFLSSISDEVRDQPDQDEFMDRMWNAFVETAYGKDWSLFDIIEASGLEISVSDAV